MQKRWVYKIAMGILMGMLALVPAAVFAAGAAPSAQWALADGSLLDGTLNLGPEDAGISLRTGIPSGKILKAWSLTVSFDPAKVGVIDVTASPGAPFGQATINRSLPGKIIANAFNVDGVSGPVQIPLIDVRLKGLAAGTSDLSVVFDHFGASSTDEFRPPKISLSVSMP